MEQRRVARLSRSVCRVGISDRRRWLKAWDRTTERGARRLAAEITPTRLDAQGHSGLVSHGTCMGLAVALGALPSGVPLMVAEAVSALGYADVPS